MNEIVPQADIIKRLTVQRGKPSDLSTLLYDKGFPNGYDGWRGTIKSLNNLSATKPQEIEVVCFRPTEEEHSSLKNPPEVFAKRKLVAASLWEMLALLPDYKGYGSRDSFFEEFGKVFVMFAHGHWYKTWAGGQPVYIRSKYGATIDFGHGLLISHKECWYVGFRKVKESGKKED